MIIRLRPRLLDWDEYGYSAQTAEVIHDDETPLRRQPVGFRGAAPGHSYDWRGLPRVRVPAVMRRGGT
jgi:hypothetical protein